MIEKLPLYERHPAPWRYEPDPFYKPRWVVYDANGNIILMTRQEAKAKAVASIPQMDAFVDSILKQTHDPQTLGPRGFHVLVDEMTILAFKAMRK